MHGISVDLFLGLISPCPTWMFARVLHGLASSYASSLSPSPAMLATLLLNFSSAILVRGPVVTSYLKQ